MSLSLETVTNNPLALNVLNLVSFIANIALVNGVPTWFNLPDNAELSQKYQTIITPAGWAFAIWGLIFLLQAIWAVVQVALPAYRTNPLVVEGVRLHYVWVCLCQVAWTFAFSLELIGLSMIFMLGILYFLSRIYAAQQKILIEGDVTYSNNYWLLRLPFGLHLGWIIAATLVNANVVFVAHRDTLSTNLQLYAAVLTLVITLVVTAGILFHEAEKTHPDVVIPLVLVWALNAISVELKDPKDLIIKTFTPGQIDIIKNGASTAAILVLVSSLATVARSWWKNRSRRNANAPSEAETLLEQR